MLLVAHTIFAVNDDGVGKGPTTGKVRLTAARTPSFCAMRREDSDRARVVAQVLYQPWAMSGLTHVFANQTFAMATPAAYFIVCFDSYEAASQPHTHELPRDLMDLIASDPTSSLAVTYRNYVKTVLLPLCRRVTGILRAHSAAIEVWCHSHICIRRSMSAAAVSSHHRCSDCSDHHSSGSLKR